MRKNLTQAGIIFVLVFILPLLVPAQNKVIGKLYTKSEANQVYGLVRDSVNIDTKILKSLAAKSPEYLMFNLTNGKLIILDKARRVLFSNDKSLTEVAANVPFHVFSTSKVLELLTYGEDSSSTQVEMINNDVLTITNGKETLEQSSLCPPICW